MRASDPTPSDGTPLERLIRATPGLVAERHLPLLLQRIADLCRELLDAKYSAVGLLKPDHRTLETFTTSGIDEARQLQIGKLPAGHGALGLVIREGQVVRLRDLTKHPSSVGFPPGHPPMHSFLGVPIVGHDGILGDLYLTEKIGAEEFSDDDVRVALLLASIVSSAVENARFHDQTSRLLEEVQQLHRSRERFFSMVNHELRNSLAAVFGWAELQVRKKDPGTVPRGSFEILEAAEQAVSLINDLLDLNRLDEDRLKPVFRDLELSRTIRASIQRVTPSADEKRIRFRLPDFSTPTVCYTDAHRVEQILVNVLTNAVRHTPPDSEIAISLETEISIAILSIDDQGEGVAPDDVEKIFDIYYTAAGSVQTGAGVGLPLSRRLARLLNGDLFAIARPEGGRFVLKLPLAKP